MNTANFLCGCLAELFNNHSIPSPQTTERVENVELPTNEKGSDKWKRKRTENDFCENWKDKGKHKMTGNDDCDGMD